MEKFINGSAQTTLNGSIDASQTTLTVASSSLFDTAVVGNFRIRIDDELMLCTNISGTTWTVTRGVEGTAADVHSNGANVDYTLTAGAIEQYRKDNYGMGAHAAKPSVAQAGMRYFCTDAPYMLHYNGSSWKHFGPIWPLRRPVEADCTWLNQGSTTFVNQTFILPVASGLFIRGMHQTLPGSTYKVEGLWTCQETRDIMGEYWGAGVYIRDSASGKVITWGPFNRNTGGYRGDVVKWNNENSYNASYWTLTSQLFFCIDVPQRSLFYRIRSDGTNRFYEFSANGFRWAQWHSTTNSDFLTPDQGGFCAICGHATLVNDPTFLHYRVW